MKKKFMILTTIVLMSSCMAPRDKKTAYSDPFAGSSTYIPPSGNVDPANGGVAVDTGGGTTGTGGSNIPTELQHCQWAYDGVTGFTNTATSHLGPHTICQSRNSESDIYVQMNPPAGNTRVCVIPTYETSGRSIYLGEARCQFIDSSTKIYKFPLVKNRDYGNYQNFAINGVMVMKEETTFYDSPYYRDQIHYDAYFICSIQLDLHGDAEYCNEFRNKGHYVYKKF